MRVLLNDYGGYPFPAQLSHELARREHVVHHAFCTSLAGTPPGTYSDQSREKSATLRPISLRQIQQKTSLLKRRSQDIEYGKLLVQEIESFRPDIVISANTPLDAQRVIHRYCVKNGIPIIYWLQDLISIAIETILSRKYSILGLGIGKYYQRLEQKLLLQSHKVITISTDFLQQLSLWGINHSNISVIENWAPLDQFPRIDRKNAWSAKNGLDDKFVFMYSGTLSLKHNPLLLVDLARSLTNQDGIVLVRSQGEAADWLKTEASRLGLTNLIVQPFGPATDTAMAFASADVLVALLETEAGAFSVPSKVLAYFCAARPVLLAVPAQNLAAKIVRRNHTGFAVNPKDSDQFIEAANRLYTDSALRQTMGDNARNYAETNFNIKQICDRFEKEIASSVASQGD